MTLFADNSGGSGHKTLFMAIAGEAIHEMNNLLITISGYAQMGLANTSKHDTDKLFTNIANCTKQAGDLSKDLLKFARPSPVNELGNTNEAVKSVLDFFEFKSAKGYADLVDKTTEFDDLVGMSTGNLRLIVANLVKNAFDAVNGIRSRIIEVSTQLIDHEVCISVWNSGNHIGSDMLQNIFKPFFTTKIGESGNGLGLSMIRRLVTQVGGRISVKNQATGGVWFKVTLPVVVKEVNCSNQASDVLEARSLEGHTALIVDDDAGVRSLLQLTIGRMGGADIETCQDGYEALDVLKSKEFDVLILDMRMPGLSGQQVFDQLSETVKRRVVFITGDTLNSRTLQFLDKCKQPALLKPFDQKELLDVVKGVMS